MTKSLRCAQVFFTFLTMMMNRLPVRSWLVDVVWLGAMFDCFDDEM